MDTIKIQIDTNAENASKSFENLSKSFKKADNGAQDLRKDIKDLKAELFKLTPGTKEYIKTLNELGSKMDQYSDSMREARAATGQLDTVFETTTRATASLAGGFSAAIGVVTLFGGESEELMKILVKLQAVMNITNGLKEFASFFKNFDQATVAVKSYTEQLREVGTTAAAVGTNMSSTASVITATSTAATAAAASQATMAAAEAQTTAATQKETEALMTNSVAVNKNFLSWAEREDLHLEVQAGMYLFYEELEHVNSALLEEQEDIEGSTAQMLAFNKAVADTAAKHGMTTEALRAQLIELEKHNAIQYRGVNALIAKAEAEEHVAKMTYGANSAQAKAAETATAEARAQVQAAEAANAQATAESKVVQSNDTVAQSMEKASVKTDVYVLKARELEGIYKLQTANTQKYIEQLSTLHPRLARNADLQMKEGKALEQTRLYRLAYNKALADTAKEYGFVNSHGKANVTALKANLEEYREETIATVAAQRQKTAAAVENTAAETANTAATTVNTVANTANATSETASATASSMDTKSKVVNTAATEANTAATTANTAANTANMSAVGKAFPMLKMFGERFKSIVSLLKGVSGVTWVAFAAVSAFVGMLVHMYKESKAVQEQLEKTAETEKILNGEMITLDETMKSIKSTTDSWTGETLLLSSDIEGMSKKVGALTDRLTDYDKRMNAMIEGYRKLGVSQEMATKLTVQYTRSLLEQARASYDSEIALAKQYATSKKTADLWEHHNELAKEAAELVKKYEQALNDLTAVNVPDWMLNMNTQYEKFTRDIQRAINQGVITEGEGIQRQLNKSKDDLNELNNLVNDWYSGDSNLIMAANKRAYELGFALSEEDSIDAYKDILQQRIKSFTEQLEDYNDKAARSLAQSSATTIKKSNEELAKAIKGIDLKKYYEEYRNQMEAFQSLTGDSDMIDETAQARLYQWQVDFKKRLDEFVTTQIDAAKKLNLTKQDYSRFISELQSKVTDFETFMANSAFPFPPELDAKVREMQELMVTEAQTFARLNTKISALVKEGRVTTQEYTAWLEDYITKYQETIAKNASDGNALIDQILESMNVSDEEKESLRLFWSELFDFSDNILPSETAKAIEDAVTGMIDTAFDKIEKDFEGRKDRFSMYWEDMTRSWLEGGQNTSYWGDSATATFNKMQKQAEDLYNLLHEEYTQEAAAIQEKMHLLDENSAAYQEYYNKLAKLRQADADAQAQYETSSAANIRQYSDNIMDTAGKFGDAVSGLAGAMGSYYAEQAEQAKEMYGENSEEYKKYLKKEGNMKIAQVWTDAATGIMSAWATSEQLGPIAGPILAAIQTATLLATAVASTQQIKRQTQANASGGESTANVGQLTDRVIMAEAQNTDQTAQLNAEYNQGATRVFVTVDDINNGQDANRTAVTNNRF